jgi:hypothetical protein
MRGLQATIVQRFSESMIGWPFRRHKQVPIAGIRERLQVEFDLIGSVPPQMPEATRTRNLKFIEQQSAGS